MSTALSIRCPHCRRKLKVENRRLLGKKVKCPGCARPFVTRDPSDDEEVTLHLASDDDPPVGTSPRWVPDEPAVQPGPARREETAPEIPSFGSPPEQPQFAIPDPPSSGTSELQRLRQRRKKGNWAAYAVCGAVLLAGIGTVAFVVHNGTNTPHEARGAAAGTGSPPPAPELQGGGDPLKPYSQARLEGDENLVRQFAPTEGEPIQLYMMPSGVNLLFHLRPAQLWSEEYAYKVLRASLTDEVANWVAAKLREVCRREPAQIEEALIGLILGARGTEPHVCAVVRLREPAKMSDLLEEFKGAYLYDITEKPDLRLRVDDDYGYLIHDERTIAICPAPLAGELEHWIRTPNYEVTEGIARLLEQTDRERLFTVVGDVNDLRIHLPYLFPEATRPALEQVLGWLGEDVDTASWSVHTEPYFHSEVALRPVNTSSVSRLRTRMRDQLGKLPRMVWQQVSLKMQPRELRFRQFIGRFPAMLEAYQRSTVLGTGPGYLKMTTVLPAKAAPNLALAALFTVDEASRTDFAAERAPMAAADEARPKLPETVAERMRLLVDAEFDRTPLEPALQYLCDEIRVNLFVDGDALKDAGYTKNMPQTFNLGKVPMERALAEIVNAYQERDKEMVVSVNEQTKTITLLTKKFAEQQGLPIYPLKAE